MALVSELVSWGLPPQSLVQEGVSHEVVELCCRELGLSVPNTSAATETVHATPVPPPPPAMRPAQRPVANPESRADPSSSRAPFVRPQARTENDSKRPPPLLARIDTQSNGPIVVPSETSIDAVLPATPSVTYRAPSAAPSMEHRAESTEVSIAPGSSIVDLTTPPATATIKAHDDSPFTPGSVKPALDPQLEAELNARRRVLESMRRRAKGAVASTKPESVHGVLQPPQSDSESDYEPPEPDPEPEDDKVDGEPMQGDGHASDMDGVPLEDDEEDVDMDLGSPEAEEENEEGQIPAVESTAPMLQSAVPTAPRNHGYKDMDAPQPEVDPASMYDEESIESPEPSVPLRRARISYADDFTGRPSAPTGEVDHNAPLPTLDQPRLPPRPSPRAIAESETSSISTKPSFASFLSRPTTPIIGLRAPRNRRPVAADFDGTTPGGYGSWSAGIGRPAPRQFLPESNYRRKVVIEWSDDEEGDDESMDDNEKRQGKHDNPQLRRATAMQIFDLWLAEEMRRGSDVGFFAHPSNVASAADTSTTSRTTTPPTAPRLDRLRAAGAHVQTPGASGAENGNGMSSEARRILDQKEREIRAMMERIREIERKKNGGAPNVPDSVDAVLKSISDPDQPEAEIAAALDANTASTSANDGQGADSSKASEPVSVLNGANPAQPLEQERAQPEPLQAQPSSSSGSAQPSAFKLDPALQAQKEALLATLKAKAKASGMKRKREREIVSENKSEEGFAFDTEARESGHEKRFRWGGAGEVEATVKKEAQNIEDARSKWISSDRRFACRRADSAPYSKASRQDFPPEAQDDPASYRVSSLTLSSAPETFSPLVS